jgi:hypothetical protein
VVGLGSFALYMAAFFFPEVHRKNDFIWSGVGLFYALVLWIFADRIRGGMLLGQAASVALLGWLGWQVLGLRRQVVPIDQQTELPTAEELKRLLSNLSNSKVLSKLPRQAIDQLDKLKNQIQDLTGSVGKPQTETKPELDEPYVPLTRSDFASARRNREAETFIEVEAEQAIADVEEATSDLTNEAQPAIDELDEAFEIFPEQASETVQDVSEAAVSAVNKPTEKTRKAASAPTEHAKTSPSLKEKETGVLGVVADVFKGLFKKKESKPIYVRKQYRTPVEEIITDAEFDEAITEEAELIGEAVIAESVTNLPIAEIVIEETTEIEFEDDAPDSVNDSAVEAATEHDTSATIVTPSEVEPTIAQKDEAKSAPANLGSSQAEPVGEDTLPVANEVPQAELADAELADVGLEPSEAIVSKEAAFNPASEASPSDALPQEPTESEQASNLDNSFDLVEAVSQDIDALFQESTGTVADITSDSFDAVEPVPEIDALFQETFESSDPNLITSFDVIEEVSAADILLQEATEAPADSSPSAFSAQEESSVDVDALFQDQPETTSTVDTEAIPHASLENPFVEALAEEPILMTDELLGEEKPISNDASFEDVFQDDGADEEMVLAEEVEIEFEPEGTIDLNNLEGLFEDTPLEESLNVDSLFPEDVAEGAMSLEEAFRDPNASISEADRSTQHQPTTEKKSSDNTEPNG